VPNIHHTMHTYKSRICGLVTACSSQSVAMKVCNKGKLNNKMCSEVYYLE